jgi:hypothetical protein
MLTMLALSLLITYYIVKKLVTFWREWWQTTSAYGGKLRARGGKLRARQFKVRNFLP